MLSHLKNIYIPHEGNDHKPHAVRPKALKWYAVIVVGIKVISTILLFIMFPDPALLSAEIETEILELTNQNRITAGLNALEPNAELSRAAREKAADMLLKEYFNHQAPDGRYPWDFINKEVYEYFTAGENLAIDFGSSSIAHNALMNSPSHRNNILGESFTHIGIGVVSGEYNGRHTNILVEMYGGLAPEKQAPKIVKTAKAAKIPPTPQIQEEIPIIAEQKTTTETVPEITEPKDEDVLLTIGPVIRQKVNLDSKETKTPAPAHQDSLEKETVTEEKEPQKQPVIGTTNSEDNITVVGTKKRASKLDIMFTIMTWSRRALYAALVYLILVLSLKIFIKIRIQHAPVIAQTLMLIVAIGILASIHWHTIERLTNTVKIL